jgi:molybdopterin molybdotransferase
VSELIELDELRDAVLARRVPLPAITIAPRDALGFVLAAPVVATESIPSFVNSAMDGYALRSADTAPNGARLRVVGATMAGEAPGRLGPGEAIRIMTGAPMPFGADAVCIQEEADEDGSGSVTIPGVILKGRNVRLTGEDISAGTQVFAAGTELGAAHLGVLAAIGERTVVVHRQPVVGVLSTGDELVGDGAPLGEGKIRDANRPALLALVAGIGARAVDLGIVGDDASELLSVLERAAANCDAVVVSGGASHGDRDPLARVLEKMAGSSRVRSFHAAIRPAKPFVFGEIGERFTPVFGLPGNPVSAIVACGPVNHPRRRGCRLHAPPGRQGALRPRHRLRRRSGRLARATCRGPGSPHAARPRQLECPRRIRRRRRCARGRRRERAAALARRALIARHARNSLSATRAVNLRGARRTEIAATRFDIPGM